MYFILVFYLHDWITRGALHMFEAWDVATSYGQFIVLDENKADFADNLSVR